MKISSKWSDFALSLFGNKGGEHCHWCKFIESDGGEAHCINKKSEFCDEDRIRTWDGIGCAKKCGYFELDEWYTSDANFGGS